MTCAKRHVTATIVALDGQRYVGTNHCLTPVTVCPRKEGEGYEKCRTVCKQPAHAEIAAIECAGANTVGATMYVEGHDHMCTECGKAAFTAGLSRTYYRSPPP